MGRPATPPCCSITSGIRGFEMRWPHKHPLSKGALRSIEISTDIRS